MGFFDNLNKQPEPQLTVKSSSSENRRGRGSGSENIDLQNELIQRQNDYNDYRNKMLSGELGSSFGSGQGEEQLNELSRLDDLVKETQAKIAGRDERNLGIGAAMGALSGLGVVTAGELAAQRDVGGSGTLGGNQQKSGSRQRAEPTEEQVKAFIDQYYNDNPNIPKNNFNDAMLEVTYKKNYGKDRGGLKTPESELPPQMIDEDDIRTEQINEAIDKAPPMPTSATQLGGPPSSVGSKNLSSIGNIFGGGDKGNLLDRIGERAGQMAEEMAGISPEDIERGTDYSEPEEQITPRIHDPNIDIIQNPDIESTEKTFSGNTDPFIETGKEAKAPDVSIFLSMLHVGTKISFEYLKEISGYADQISVIQNFVPFELQNIVESAVNTLQTTRADDIGSLRTSSNNRMKFHIKDKKHDVVHNPVLYPFLVIALNFYMAKNEGTLIKFNWMVKQSVAYVLKSLGLPSQNVDYFLKIYSSYPDSLNQAFIENKNLVVGVNEIQKKEIKAFIEMVINEYNTTFTPNKFVKDVRKYEAGGQSLLNILQNLINPRTLFEINKTFETVDNFLLDVENNKDILLGLVGLIYAESRNAGDMVGAAMIDSAMVDGIVYYKKTVQNQQKINIDLELMMQMSEKPENRRLEGYEIKFNSEKLAEFENQQGDTNILFRGTNFNEADFMKKDFIQNILNFSGSKEIFLDEEYNQRYQKGIELILKKLQNIDNTGKGSLKIQGYSLGGIGAMYTSVLFPDVETIIYNPVISNTELTKELIDELVRRNSNIKFFAVEGDPISSNLKNYKEKLNIKYFKKNRFFNSHSLNNYKFI